MPNGLSRTFFLTTANKFDTGYDRYPAERCEVLLDVQKIEAPLNLSEKVYSSIKKSIVNMDWSNSPREIKLDERRIAEKLGVSRTPLREAIKRLMAEGFVRVESRKGLFVVNKSKADMLEILLVRSVLEGLGARLAASRVTKEDIHRMKMIFAPFSKKSKKGMTRNYSKYSEANIKFHESILQLSQCRKLIEMAGNIFDHMRWIRSWSVYNASFQRRFPKTHKEHLEIIKAIEERDSDLAEKRIRAHIEGLFHLLE
jgi:DNA-binding GntR family transcriptional regulator